MRLDPSQRLQHHDRYTGKLLASVRLERRDDFSGRMGHIMGGDPIEDVNHDIVVTRWAAAKILDGRFQLLVFARDDFFDDVLYPTTASSRPAAAGTPVKVEPVVPVSRTRW